MLEGLATRIPDTFARDQEVQRRLAHLRAELVSSGKNERSSIRFRSTK
jgi:hypothetical protein